MKKTLFFLLFLVCSVGISDAKEKNDAIYCWVDGTSTCYQLASMPKVTYADDQAILTLGTSTEPVLVVSLAGGRSLKVVYGQYATGVEDVNASNSSVRPVGKMIYGGRLIVVRDGKYYDAQGRRIYLEQDK